MRHHRPSGLRVCNECADFGKVKEFRSDPTGRPGEVCSRCRTKLRRSLKAGKITSHVVSKKRGYQPKPTPAPKLAKYRDICKLDTCIGSKCTLWHQDGHMMLDERKLVHILESPQPACRRCKSRSVKVTGKLEGFWLGGAVYMQCRSCDLDLPPLVLQEPLEQPSAPAERPLLSPERDCVVLPHGAFTFCLFG